MSGIRPMRPPRGARATLVALLWTLVVLLVGARVALFDEIRVMPSGATVSIGAHGAG
jgi:hypothetical protein